MRRRTMLQAGGLTAASLLTACGPVSKPQQRKPYNAAISLGFSQLGAESAWRLANTASIKKAAPLKGVTLDFRNAEGRQDRQFEAIRAFVAAKVDVIAFSPVVEGGWDAVLNEVKQAGIPVIVTDRLIDSADTSLYASAIGANFRGEGGLAGVWLSANTPRAAGPVSIVEIRGEEGSAPAIQRAAGFREAVAGKDSLRIIDSTAADWTVAGGKAAMRRLLAEHRRIDVVFAHNDDMGLGAIDAIEETDRRPGRDIKLITVDASRAGLTALAAGKLNNVVECSPLIGPQLMNLVVDLYLGIRVPPRVYTEMRSFGPADARAALPDRVY